MVRSEVNDNEGIMNIQRSRCSSRKTSSSHAPSPWTQRSSQACNSSRKVHGLVQSSTTTQWYVEEQMAAAENEVRGRCMKEPMMGRCTRVIGQVCLYAWVNHVRDAFIRVKCMTDLFLPHRVRRPSRIPLQSLCVAHVFQHPRVVFGEG
jgi:hypothetical protein